MLRVTRVIKDLFKCIIPKESISTIKKIFFKIKYPDIDEEVLKKTPEIMNINETLEYIVKNKASISRFGDGEFGFILHKGYDSHFQKSDIKLESKLKYIIRNPIRNNLLCLNYFIKQKNLKDSYWNIWNRKYLRKIVKYLDNKYVYGNANIFTPESFNENIILIKKIWYKKDVLLITGENSTFLLDERLFGGVHSLVTIKTKSHSAFDDYERILEIVKKYDKKYLVLIAAGMAATCWSYDLTLEGFQCIDIGHIVNYYLESIGESDNIETLRRKGIRVEKEYS